MDTQNIQPTTFGEKVIAFNRQLQYNRRLPAGFDIINPFMENAETLKVMECFYKKFYSDYHKRKFIIGINPSRHGAAITGVPFTDTKRLKDVCGIPMASANSHETSSVFIYKLIELFGGPVDFYQEFYINSPFPLAIIQKNPSGRWINVNYYDNKDLYLFIKPFMIETLRNHISFGLDTTEVYALGKKNAIFLNKINAEEKFFDRIVPLDHPRFIQQYKLKMQGEYVQHYLRTLSGQG